MFSCWVWFGRSERHQRCLAQGEPPPIALMELVVDGMNCCTKGVSAGRQGGTAGCKSHTNWLSFFSYLDRNCAKELREIDAYLPLRLLWFLRPFIFGQGAKNSTGVPRGDFSKQIFLPLCTAETASPKAAGKPCPCLTPPSNSPCA